MDEIILDEIIFYLVVMMRLTGMIFFNNLLGRSNVPAPFRIGLIIMLTYYTVGFLEVQTIEADTWLGLGIIMLKELFIGYFMGYIVSGVLAIAMVAGELLDMQLGIAMAKIYDPQSNVSMPITGSIFNAMFILTFFLANGHITLIYLMVESFAVIPAGHIVIHQEMFVYCVSFVATLLTLALKLALPFIAVQFVVEVAVGILMKAIPQINVFVLNIQLKLFMGFMLIFSLTPEIAEFMDSMLLLLLDSLSRGIYQFFS